jgi:Protein of unknown function (DUF3828)
MNRRQFLLAMSGAVALFVAAQPSRAECGGPGITEFIETLYQKQARLQAADTALSEDEFRPLFARGMRRLIRAPRHFPKNMLFGPILNAFFGWGVFPGAEVKVGNIEIDSGDELGPATVRVAIEHHGEPHRILVHVIREKDDWRIANIVYDSGKSLIDHYRAFTGRRG